MYNLKKRGLLFTFLAVMILSKCFSLEVFSKGNEVIGGKTETVSKEAAIFKDVTADHWAYRQIQNLANKNIINGFSDGSFKPGDNITRAQAAVMIVNDKGLKHEGKVAKFSDVPKNHWASGHIAAAQESGIINGYKDGSFKPGDKITRAQIAVMIANAYDIKETGTKMNFKDVTSGSNEHWAYKHINILASNGIINGYGDGSFKPGELATRAHFSVILSNTIDKDTTPPEVDLDSLVITKKGTEVIVDFECVEEESGLKNILFDFYNGEAMYRLESDGDIKQTATGYQVSLDVSNLSIGTYTLNNISVSDNTGNIRSYDKADYVLEKYKFELTLDDFKVPALENIETSVKYTDESIDVNIKIDWIGEYDSINYISLSFYDESIGHYLSVDVYQKDIDENGNIDYVKQLNKHFPSGTYKLCYIGIGYADETGDFNSTKGYPETVIVIQNEDEDIVPPEIDLDSLKITQEGAKVTIDFECVEDKSGLKNVMFTFYDGEMSNIYDSYGDIKQTSTGYQIIIDTDRLQLGAYTLESISVSDNAGNSNFYDKSNDALGIHKFEITSDDL